MSTIQREEAIHAVDERRRRAASVFASFDNMFSIPRPPSTLLAPGQYFEMKVPPGKKVIITDIYIENWGNGKSFLEIHEQQSANSFDVRYTFQTAAQQVTIINFTTGLKLGDEDPIAGSIRIKNSQSSKASILPRVNGVIIG